MAQLVRWSWVWIPRTHIKINVRHGSQECVCDPSRVGGDKRIPGAAVQQVYVSWWTPGSVRHPVSEIKAVGLERRLGALGDLPEDSGQLPAPTCGSQPPVTPVPGDPRSSSLFWILWVPATHVVYEHTCRRNVKCLKVWSEDYIQNQPLDCSGRPVSTPVALTTPFGHGHRRGCDC